MTLAGVLDFLLPATSIGGAVLVTSPRREVRRAGFICGLLSQPMWALVAYEAYIAHGRYGVAITTTFYTAAWIRGIITHSKED